MKRLLVLAIVLLLVSTLTVTSVLAARDPFIGAWESIDIDESYQTLTIGGGPDNTYHVRYYDFGASVCNPPDTDGFLYTASARGLLAGTDGSIAGTISVYCMTHPPTFWGDATVTMDYDTSNDTIIGSDNVVWHRRKNSNSE